MISAGSLLSWFMHWRSSLSNWNNRTDGWQAALRGGFCSRCFCRKPCISWPLVRCFRKRGAWHPVRWFQPSASPAVSSRSTALFAARPWRCEDVGRQWTVGSILKRIKTHYLVNTCHQGLPHIFDRHQTGSSWLHCDMNLGVSSGVGCYFHSITCTTTVALAMRSPSTNGK